VTQITAPDVEIGVAGRAYLGRGLAMSVLSALCLFALILVSAILCMVAIFGAIVILAYRDRRAGFSYFANGVRAPKVRDEDKQDV
jgi:hypothetical protein